MIFHILLGPFLYFVEFFCSEQLFCSKAKELGLKKKGGGGKDSSWKEMGVQF